MQPRDLISRYRAGTRAGPPVVVSLHTSTVFIWVSASTRVLYLGYASVDAGYTFYDGELTCKDAEELTGITQQQVSRWRKRLEDEDKNRAGLFAAALLMRHRLPKFGQPTVSFSPS